jgi:hypothetical protein
MMEEGGCVLLIELLWLTASSYTPSAYLYDICKLYVGGLSLSRKHHKRPFIKSSEVASNALQAPVLALYAIKYINSNDPCFS